MGRGSIGLYDYYDGILVLLSLDLEEKPCWSRAARQNDTEQNPFFGFAESWATNWGNITRLAKRISSSILRTLILDEIDL